MSWFRKSHEEKYFEPESKEPTYYINTPVEIQKEYSTWNDTDDDGHVTVKVSDDLLTYTARTTVGSTEVKEILNRYIGVSYNAQTSEAETLNELRQKLYLRVEKTKELQNELPLGTWLPVDWSNPNKDNG